MKKNRKIHNTLIITSVMLSHIAAVLHASDVYWDGVTGGWDNLLNWSTAPGAAAPDPGALPGAADNAIFNIDSANAAENVDLNGDRSVLGLLFGSSGATSLLGGGTNRTLTLGTGGIMLNATAGTVTIGSLSAGQNVAIALAGPQSWTNNSTAALTMANGIALGAHTLTIAGTGFTALQGTTTGTGGIVKTGSGTLSLTGANAHTGITDVQGGTLIANYNSGGAVTVLPAAGTVNVAGGATFKAIANDANFTLATKLSGSGTVVIDPHATGAAAVREVAITGANVAFTGTLRLSPSTDVSSGLGTFRTTPLTAPAAGTATIDVDAGAQAWLGAQTFANNFIITGHGYAEPAAGTAVHPASRLTAYTGPAVSGLGAIRMENGAVISGNVTLDGSAKITSYNGTGTISGSIGTTNGSDTLVVGGATARSYVVLTGTNNTGANPLRSIFVNSGSTGGLQYLQIGNNGTTGTLGTGPVTLNGDAGTSAIRFDRSDGYTLAPANTITSIGTNLANTQLYFDTQGTGFVQNRALIDLGVGPLYAGTIRANAKATFDGEVSAGSLNVAVGAANPTVNIVDGAKIVLTAHLQIGETNGNGGTVNQTGGDVSGVSHMRVGHWPNNTSVYNISGGTFSTQPNPSLAAHPSGGGEQLGGIYLGIDGTGVMNQSGGTVTTDWIVLDNRGNTGAGTNQPDGIDRYNLSGGTLALRGQYGINSRNASTEVNFTGGTIKNVGAGVNVAVAGNGAFNIGSGGTGTPTFDTNGATNSITVSRAVSGSGALAKVGEGTLNLNAASTSWTGNLTVDGGTVATGAIEGGLGSFTTTGRTITVNQGATINVTTNNVFGPASTTGDRPSIVLNGGTFNATRYNAVGDVTLNGGTLSQSTTDAAGFDGYQFRGSVTVGGSTASSITTGNGRGNHLGPNTGFAVADATGSAAPDLIVNTPLLNQSAGFGSAAGGLTKSGAGTMQLTAINLYTGITTVSEGTLQIASGASTVAASTVNVSSGGTLKVDAGGIVNGAVNVAQGGTLTGSGKTGVVTTSGTIAPGSSAGKLTVAGISSGSTASFQWEIGGASASPDGSLYDVLMVEGSTALDGVLSISLTDGYAPSEGEKFFIVLNDGTDAITGTFTGLAEGSLIPFSSALGFKISYVGDGDSSGLANDVALTVVPVPEPTALGLGSLAAGLACLRRRRQ